MKTLFIEPNDVLLFRDGRSFSAINGDHLATGLFPPLPTTFYGALRSALLSHHDADFRADDFGVEKDVAGVVGTTHATGSLTITRFSLACRENGTLARYLPVPNDVLVRKDDRGKPPEERHYEFLTPKEDTDSARTNLPDGSISLLWREGDNDTVYTRVEGYLPEEAYLKLLAGDVNVMRESKKAEDLFQPEPRTSVQIDDKNTAEEGQLFIVEFTRMHRQAGFLLSVDDGRLLPESGWLRLGGEARAARYEVVPLKDDLKPKVRESRHVKLVLTTPAAFENGWRPDFIEEDGTGALRGYPVKLVSAAVGRYRHLGGWDLANGRPKRTRRAAPAGSVYFFKLEDGADAARLFADGPVLSLASGDDRKQGLALAYPGTY